MMRVVKPAFVVGAMAISLFCAQTLLQVVLGHTYSADKLLSLAMMFFALTQIRSSLLKHDGNNSLYLRQVAFGAVGLFVLATVAGAALA